MPIDRRLDVSSFTSGRTSFLPTKHPITGGNSRVSTAFRRLGTVFTDGPLTSVSHDSAREHDIRPDDRARGSVVSRAVQSAKASALISAPPSPSGLSRPGRRAPVRLPVSLNPIIRLPGATTPPGGPRRERSRSPPSPSVFPTKSGPPARGTRFDGTPLPPGNYFVSISTPATPIAPSTRRSAEDTLATG